MRQRIGSCSLVRFRGPIEMAKHSGGVTGQAGRRSVGRLLFGIGTVVSVLILLLSVVLTFRLTSEEAIVEDMREVIGAVSNETVANTESFLAPAERSAEELARLLEKGNLDDEIGLAVDELFFEVLRVNESFDGIFVGRNNGSFTYVVRNDIGGYDTKDIIVTADGTRTVNNIEHDATAIVLASSVDPNDQYDPRTRPWFDLAVEADGSGVWTAPYVFFSSGLPGVTRAQAVSLEDGREVVIGIDIRLDALSTFMGERRASPNGESFILDRELNVVAYQDRSQLIDSDRLARASDLGEPPVSFVSDLVGEVDGEEINEFTSGTVDGVDYQFAVTSLANNRDWVVAVTAPDDDFLERVRGEQLTTRSIAALGGLASVLLLAFGGLIVNNRYRREQALVETALGTAVDRANERDAAREHLARTVDELARSNADLEEYAYATAHDLRTPLRAIGGYAELILREAEDDVPPEEVTDYARRIVDGYERMCLTMDNLLEHARATTSEPVVEAVPLTPIAESVIEDFDELVTELDGAIELDHLGQAAVDPISMARIFQNLIGNSLKYRHPDRGPRVTISSAEADGFLNIHVQDNGVGIAPENHDAAFRLFNRLTDEEPGSGVGLALVKKLAEIHDGSIELESSVDAGTTVVVKLPIEPSDPPSSDGREPGLVDA